MKDLKLKVSALPTALACLTLPFGVTAGAGQQENRQQGQEQQQKMAGPSEEIVKMDQEDLYKQGISVDALLGAEVTNSAGNNVGEIEDFVIGSQSNNLVGVIIESGGFLGIGDNHLLYPFDKADIKSNEEIQADIKSSTVKELSMFREIEGESLQDGRWRASDLVGSAAYSDGEPYGRVDDVIINKSGNILAVIVQADVMYDDAAYYAWPYGYYDVEEDVYDIPADQRHRFGEEPFDAGSLQGADGTTATSGT
jgi:sporulation protein YlmC with PRC-barrel domain